jgi:hypothetical protein
MIGGPPIAGDKVKSNEAKLAGNVFFAEQDYSSALNEYQRACQLDQTNLAATTNSALCLINLDRY